MYYVTLWCVRVTTFANGKATMRSVCISELSVTVNNMKIVAKKSLSERIHVAYHINTYFV